MPKWLARFIVRLGDFLDSLSALSNTEVLVNVTTRAFRCESASQSYGDIDPLELLVQTPVLTFKKQDTYPTRKAMSRKKVAVELAEGVP